MTAQQKQSDLLTKARRELVRSSRSAGKRTGVCCVQVRMETAADIGKVCTCTAIAGAGPPDTGATPPPRMVSSAVLPATHNPPQLQRLHNCRAPDTTRNPSKPLS